MKKIAFFCIPAHGHTNPTLGVVRELISRGHEVRYYSYESMRTKIEATGAIFISCDAYDAQQTLKEADAEKVGKDLAFSTKILVDTTLALDEKVCREMKEWKPDCIVADSMAIWGKAVAQKLGIPFVSSTTTFAFNQYSAKIMKPDMKALFQMLFSTSKTAKQVRRLQERGYPIRSILDIIGNDETVHTIVYTSKEFQPCSHTFSDKYAFVGPSIRLATEEIEKTREKLIYISLGTVNNRRMPFYRMCISAFKHTNYQVILSVGHLVSLQDFSELPEHISVFSHVDQIAVLEKADVFVTHAGMNSVSESLYHSVPLLMVPQTSEQQGVASHVEKLGAGILLKKQNERTLLRGISELLTNDNYHEHAKKISRGFQNCPGAKGAADKIIEVCNERP